MVGVTMARAAIVLFTRTPEEEARRKPLLDPRRDRRLFAALIADWRRRTRHLPHVDLLVCSPRPIAESRHLPRRGHGFASLQRAANDAFARGYGRVLLVGNDAPGLPAIHLDRTLDALAASGPRAVLTPDRRGGFALLGLNAPCATLFEGLDWGAPDVCAGVELRLRRAGYVPALLPPVADIARAEDLSAALATAHATVRRLFEPTVRVGFESTEPYSPRLFSPATPLRAPPA